MIQDNQRTLILTCSGRPPLPLSVPVSQQLYGANCSGYWGLS